MNLRFDSKIVLKVSKTDEGYLKGEAIVTRTGVFRYRKKDGGIQLELRHPHEVLDSESLDTLKSLPITFDHPAEMVNAENAKALSIGMTGDGYRVDKKGRISIPITITDAESIKKIEGGKRELSLGYRADTEMTPGTFDGEQYDAVQRGIRYNHLAVVDSARAGPDARLRLDSGDAELDNDHQEQHMNLKKIKLDSGIEYDAAPEVIVALEKARTDLAAANTRADSVATELTTAKAATDKEKARADQAVADLEKAKKDSEAALGPKVTARVNLLDSARKVLGDKLKTDASDLEIMKAVIVEKNKDAKLDGVSEDYVRARFDAVIEGLKNDADAGQRGAGGGQGGGNGGGNRTDSSDARKKMMERLSNPNAKKD